MRRTNIGVVLALALSFVLVLAVLPAAAKGKPGKPPSGPGPGTTCALSGGDYLTAVEYGDFSITLSRATSTDACIDVWPQAAGPWGVTVTVNEGTLRGLTVIPRDSVSPGDSCGGYMFGKNSPSSFVLPPDSYGDSIPLPYVNACGTEFAEMVGDVSYDYADVGTPSPLAFIVFMSGSRNLDVTLRVDLPE